MISHQKQLVISAVNITEGGPLTILLEILDAAATALGPEWKITALVHRSSLIVNSRIYTIEFPKSKKFYLYRLYLEYYFFKKLSEKGEIYLWLSLHDITPNISAKIRAVYCHNPSPFYKTKIKDFFIQPFFFIFNKMYMYIYKININRNNYIVVQQGWLRNIFREKITSKPIIVCHPNKEVDFEKKSACSISKDKYTFFFPSFPRIFKNFEIIGEAVKLIKNNNIDFEVIITMNGNENNYARLIRRKYGYIEQIKFIGIISRNDVFRYYNNVDCLIFPSKLETWGLPITEFKNTGGLILVADLPYAHETVGAYKNVSFFSPDSPKELASLMRDAINGTIQCQGNIEEEPDKPFAKNWKELFDLLLEEPGAN